MAQTTKCERCRWWERWGRDGDETFGTCHRYPPTPVVSPSLVAHANSNEGYWCGEWSAIPAPKKKKEKGETNPDVPRLIDTYFAVFQDLFGIKPRFDKGADARAVEDLLEHFALEDAQWIVREFLEEPPQWNAANRTLDLKFIPKAANTILARRK